MTSTVFELILVGLGAMVSPTTLTACVLTLVLSSRPIRTGAWFYIGALGATAAVGVAGAFVIRDVAADQKPSRPKLWVAIIDVAAAILILAYVARGARRPRNPERERHMIEQIRKVSDAPAVAIVAAGATLANAGAFMALALKDLSEAKPSTFQFVLEWVAFSLVSLLPLAIALASIVVAPEPTQRALASARRWLERHARTVFLVLLVALSALLLRNGIAGLAA